MTNEAITAALTAMFQKYGVSVDDTKAIMSLSAELAANVVTEVFERDRQKRAEAHHD